MIAPYIMCKEDLAFCRESNNKEVQRLTTHWWACKRSLATCEESKNFYPDFPEFHDVYFNDTYPPTTTTTPPPVTFRAFRPTSAPYNATESPRNRRHAPLPFTTFSQKDQFLAVISKQTLSRPKRQLIPGLGLFTGVIGTFLGLYNQYEIHNIQKQLLDLTDQQTLLTNIVQKHNHIISELIKDMAHLTEIVQTLIM
jgi:hypothetical protein